MVCLLAGDAGMHRSTTSPGGMWVLVLGAGGDVCWCPEGHQWDVPVLHELEGAGGARFPSQDRWEGTSSSPTHCPGRRATLQGIE